MDSNYQWQKHQTNERVRNRMREAETHRLLHQNTPRRESFLVRMWRAVFGDREQRLPQQQPGSISPAADRSQNVKQILRDST
jgi:hypothetical protein